MRTASWRAAVAWPLMVSAAWFAGERCCGACKARAMRVQGPRVCAYAAAGMAFGGLRLSRQGARTQAHGALGFVAEPAFGLALFELGHRVNPRWCRLNPALAAGIGRALATVAAVT